MTDAVAVYRFDGHWLIEQFELAAPGEGTTVLLGEPIYHTMAATELPKTWITHGFELKRYDRWFL